MLPHIHVVKEMLMLGWEGLQQPDTNVLGVSTMDDNIGELPLEAGPVPVLSRELECLNLLKLHSSQGFFGLQLLLCLLLGLLLLLESGNQLAGDGGDAALVLINCIITRLGLDFLQVFLSCFAGSLQTSE